MCYNSLFSWYHHGLIITSVLQSSCVVWYNCEWNHTGSGNAVNCLLIDIIKADVDWLGRYPSLVRIWELRREVFALPQKKVELNGHIYTLLEWKRKLARVHSCTRSPWRRHHLVASLPALLEWHVALPSSSGFKVIGFQLPPRRLQFEYSKGVFNLSLNLYLSLSCLPLWILCLEKQDHQPASHWCWSSPPLPVLHPLTTYCGFAS